MPETQWQYDGTGRLQRVASSDGASVTVSYDDEAARTTLERRTVAGGDLANGKLAKLVFENNRMVSSESSQTGRVDYKYENRRIVSVKAERSGEMHFVYDKNGRPESVSLPSGVRVQYNFLGNGKTAPPGAAGFKIRVMGPGGPR
jgi:YD repeat-containing protein